MAEIVWMTSADPQYPALLKELWPQPPRLSYRGGVIPEDRAAVAIVGTRTPSYYGIAMAEQLAADLAGAGITIISGLARGIDSVAHRAALQAGGRTIAVLGSGLDRIYPPEHAALAEAIARQGAVLSEFPPATEALPRHFPQRNRLISGLSLGVIVVEATERSGSLITAEWAAEQNRLVFAVPGNVLSASFRGTHQLIRDGAILIERAQDVLEALEPQLRLFLPQKGPGPIAKKGQAPFPLDESKEFRHSTARGGSVWEAMGKRCGS